MGGKSATALPPSAFVQAGFAMFACVYACVCVGKYTCAWGGGSFYYYFSFFADVSHPSVLYSVIIYLFCKDASVFASTKETRAKIGVGEAVGVFHSPSPVGNSPAKRNAFALFCERRRAKRQKWQPGMTEGGSVSSPPLIPARREALRDRDKILGKRNRQGEILWGTREGFFRGCRARLGVGGGHRPASRFSVRTPVAGTGHGGGRRLVQLSSLFSYPSLA